MRLESQSVILIVGKAPIDAQYLHGLVYVRSFHVSNRARDVEDELAHFSGTGEGLRRRHHTACKNTTDEVIVQVLLRHVIDFAQHDFAFGLSRIQHDQRNAAAIGPVTFFSEENLAKIVKRAIFDRIRGIDDDRDGLLGTCAI